MLGESERRPPTDALKALPARTAALLVGMRGSLSLT